MFFLIIAAVCFSVSDAAVEQLPGWAYLYPDPIQPPEVSRPALYSLAGSAARYTQPQIDDLKAPPDWLPASHPAPPGIVVRGANGAAFACASCHLASGMGRPESASLAGLPAAYLIQQMSDFKSGARTNRFTPNASPKTDLILFMAAIASAWPDEDIKAAASYYASLKPLPRWVHVTESDTVPKSYVSPKYLRYQEPGGVVEKLGDRIIELPQSESERVCEILIQDRLRMCRVER